MPKKPTSSDATDGLEPVDAELAVDDRTSTDDDVLDDADLAEADDETTSDDLDADELDDADAADEDAADDDDEDADAEVIAASTRPSAKGATKRTPKAAKSGKKSTTAADDKRAAEKARIERSKEIAAKARGKQTPSTAKKSATGKPLTKEQTRYSQPKTAKLDDANPVWFKPIMFGFLILGFLWILVYYLSSARLPIAVLGDWNLLVGIGVAMVGFLMMTNWK